MDQENQERKCAEVSGWYNNYKLRRGMVFMTVTSGCKGGCQVMYTDALAALVEKGVAKVMGTPVLTAFQLNGI